MKLTWSTFNLLQNKMSTRSDRSGKLQDSSRSTSFEDTIEQNKIVKYVPMKIMILECLKEALNNTAEKEIYLPSLP